VRIALGSAVPTARLSATGGWRLYERGGASVLVRGQESDTWTVQREGKLLRAVGSGGTRTPLGTGPFVARPEDERSFIRVGGRRYRGEIFVTLSDSGLQVVNHLPVESYLRGVVPLEIGDRVAGEESAVAAQAVAARSYTYSRLAELGPSPRRAWDLVASVSDQVYGGVDAETLISDAGVTLTGNLVLRYAGRIVNAVYSSTCGGSTAEAPELWQTQGEPYLQRVSDRIPGTDRFYCDASPRFSWTRTLDARALASGLEAYLRRGRKPHAVGTCGDARHHHGPRSARSPRQHDSLRASPARWRDPQQHVFYGRADQRCRPRRDASRDHRQWLRSRGRDVSVGSDRPIAGGPGFPNDPPNLLSGDER